MARSSSAFAAHSMLGAGEPQRSAALLENLGEEARGHSLVALELERPRSRGAREEVGPLLSGFRGLPGRFGVHGRTRLRVDRSEGKGPCSFPTGGGPANHASSR